MWSCNFSCSTHFPSLYIEQQVQAQHSEYTTHVQTILRPALARYVAHSSSYQEFKAGGYIAYFSLEGERSAAGKAGSDSDASECWACWARCAWVAGLVCRASCLYQVGRLVHHCCMLP